MTEKLIWRSAKQTLATLADKLKRPTRLAERPIGHAGQIAHQGGHPALTLLQGHLSQLLISHIDDNAPIMRQISIQVVDRRRNGLDPNPGAFSKVKIPGNLVIRKPFLQRARICQLDGFPIVWMQSVKPG